MQPSNSLFCDSCQKIVSSNYREELCTDCHRRLGGIGVYDIKTELDLDDLQDVLNPSGKTPARISDE